MARVAVRWASMVLHLWENYHPPEPHEAAVFQSAQPREVLSQSLVDAALRNGGILATLPLGEKTGLDTLLVVGPANRRRRALVRQAAAAGVRCVVAPRDLARWMAAASLAVTAGGVTASELACVGVPMVIVVAAENQRESARGLVRARAAVALDGTTAAGIRGVGAAVCRLAKDPLRRRRMAAAGRRLVDGRGAARVARALTQLLAARREDERS